MFNYASFCKVLSIDRVYTKVEELVMNQENFSSQNLKDDIGYYHKKCLNYL
jgi:hypothetical protein